MQAVSCGTNPGSGEPASDGEFEQLHETDREHPSGAGGGGMDVDVIAKPCVDVCGSPDVIGPLIGTGPVVTVVTSGWLEVEP